MKTMMWAKVQAAGVVLAAAVGMGGISAAAVMSAIHVATTGNDGGPGTSARPVATLRKAFGLAVKKNEPVEIVIRKGVYRGGVQLGKRNERTGGPRPRILIRAAKGADGAFEEVVFDGARHVDRAQPVPGKNGVFKVPGRFRYTLRTDVWEADTRARYTLVADRAAVEHYPASFWFTETALFFHTSDGKPPRSHKIGISRDSSGILVWRSDVTVRGLKFHNFLSWHWACGLELRGARTVGEDCHVWNSYRGFQLMMDAPGIRVVRCSADDVGGGFYSSAVGAVVEDCRFRKIRDGFMVSVYSQNDTGIQFYYPARGGVVRRNLCVGFANGIFVKCPTSEFIVENNTCVYEGTMGFSHGMGCTSWHPKSVFRNNIVQGFMMPILWPHMIQQGALVDTNCLWAGGRNLVRKLPPDGGASEWVTPTASVTLEIQAHDNVSKPARMKLKVGEGAWTSAAPFQSRKSLRLSVKRRFCPVSVRVSDEAGNWSEPASILFLVATRQPRLMAPPVVYASRNGVVISFETDTPCRATVEFGVNARYGSTFEQPKGVQRTWIASDGGEWIAVRSRARVTNYLVLLPPQVSPDRTYHYRLLLEDEVGNKRVTRDASFQVRGETRTSFVSPDGEDSRGRGTRTRPWRTIQYAVDRALPGDRVVLLPGLYPGQVTLSHGGLEGAPITIEAERPGTAILDGRHEVSACLRLEKAPHVVIKGFEIRWFKYAGVAVTDSPGVTVSSCKIWNDFWMGWPTGSGVAAQRSPGLTCDRNVIYQMEQGIRLVSSPRARVTYNTITANMYGAVKFIYSAGGSVSRNNSFCFSGNDQYVVLYKNKKEFDSFDSDYNNLGTQLRKPEPSEPVAVDDPVFGNKRSKAIISLNSKRYNSLKAWQQATGKDAHSIFKNPKYVSPSKWDYRLRPGSPNIGAGEGGTTIGALGIQRK